MVNLDKTTDMASVTIVIPTLNEEKYIARCLSSITQLRYPREYISTWIVDSGSTDATIEVASAFNVNIKTVPRHTIGFSRNAASLTAKTDVIAFLDADCIVQPEWLERGVVHFADLDVVAVGSYPLVPEAESNKLQKVWSKLCRQNDSEVHIVEWLPSANLLVRASVFRTIGGFHDFMSSAEDVDLGYRLSERGKVIYDPNVIVYHLREPATIREFFRKEVWHGRSSLAGIKAHGIRFSEVPSIIAPVLFGGGLTLTCVGLVLKSPALIEGLFLSLGILLLYSIRGYMKTGIIALPIGIYSVYLLARYWAFISELLVQDKRELIPPG